MNINKFRNIAAPLLMLAVGCDASASSLYFVQTDQLNTPRAITDQSNALVWKWDSDPYGSVPPNEQPAGGASFVFNLRFPGQVFDRETYIYYNYYRDYDPQTGRYVQSDPIGLRGGINTYGYVGGNPLSGIDPSGLACVSANGKTTCQYPGGPGFGVPSTQGFPASLGPDNWFYHNYDVSVSMGKADRKCVMDELQKHATPGKSNGSSPDGNWNDAQVGPFHNPVKSYTTMDLSTGAPLVVNLTTKGGVFADGYVARGIVGSNVHTWGEGDSPWQSPYMTGFDTQFMANELVWGNQMREIVKKCSCEK
ncbi:hypothetical protein RugamoR57_04930 [Duganella caerulea]|uniref:RHS repeat domain-containing protein n=1 Tax=Duganella caerulea TaxID=2885762 RepID=UPI0030E8A770